MGSYINEEITTKLHYEDIVLIAVAFGEFARLNADSMDKEQKERMSNLVRRLGAEMYSSPKNNEPNSH
jgi:hypothetical protein